MKFKKYLQNCLQMQSILILTSCCSVLATKHIASEVHNYQLICERTYTVSVYWG